MDIDKSEISKAYTKPTEWWIRYHVANDKFSDPFNWNWEKLLCYILDLEDQISELQRQLDEDQE